ncbi:CRISPR-associated protein, Csn1 family [Croceitalea dokdonensis DOKDO 023]|uniref:CRISPR-associated endonuclease Cas9 n=1 Tax=Croceitalea dokdonensis DOKDO 023 TaxID=1300341 RepID=A0A0P7AYC1_9FLAO|nr:type II CRISPR RNA-guided endonuclease Cas9 [Croceitalea dokdonensis]KPM33104.1 CRISPR-associated protein, Csn1 family [Croceitalea dokdonensis DOKDO 023]
MKRILGLDLGTNSIGWALIENDFNRKEGKIEALGSRIIPMSQDILGKFDSGVTVSQTAARTNYRGIRRLYQRDNLRRERLHRVLNILGFLPKHYAESIDFEDRLGQFKPETEVKLPYRKDSDDNYHFIFQESFNEMVEEFQFKNPSLFYTKANGEQSKIPYDWTLYYLRKKALSKKISKEELAWILLNFNQKRGYYQLRGEEEADSKDKLEEYHALKVSDVQATEDTNAKGTWYNVILENGWIYRRQSKDSLFDWKGKTREFIVTTSLEKGGAVKIDKEGNEKRSFRAVDSEKDWIAIKKKTENDLANAGTTVGVYIYETLLRNPDQKIRGKLIKTIERKYYLEELKAILAKQIQEHAELQNRSLYKDCIEELYQGNEAHKNNIKENGFDYLFLEDIIFYQRPLKSKKSTISNCPYESRVFIKDGKKEIQPIKCISKSNPIYQEFRLWQFIHNLKIYEKEAIDDGKTVINKDVTTEFLNTQEAYAALFEFLNDKAEISQNALLKYFKLSTNTHRWNNVEDKKYPCNETRSEFIKRLSKMDGIDLGKTLSPAFEKSLWHIIYSVKDKKQYVRALETFAMKNGLDINQFRENFEKFKPYDSAYGAYSEKALKKVLPLIRRGTYWKKDAIPAAVQERIVNIMKRIESVDFNLEKIENFADDDIPKQLLKSFAKGKDPMQGLNTYQACYAVYNRHSEVSDIQLWKSPEDITKYLDSFKQHSLRNPIVEQVVMETLRVVRDIWQYYGNGAKDFFSEIHVELGREMKNDKKTRERISKSITENENTNERIKNILKELMGDEALQGDIRPYSKGHQDILKLYEEGVFANAPETYKNIKIDDIEKIRKNNSPSKSDIVKYKLWLEQGYISPYTGSPIPLSRLFTTDYQIEHIIPRSRYFDDSMGNKIICESAVNEEKTNKTAYEFIKENAGRIIDLGQGKQVPLFDLEAYESHCRGYFKGNTKKLKFLLSEDIPEGFINRQLNDSRYISKVVTSLLSNVVREEGEQEATSKNLVPLVGTITSKLKKDWGLEAIWDDLIAPRFERMNQLTKSTDFRKEVIDGHGNRYFINTVPDDIKKGFSKKRIDHRHHALDALVIACTTKDHVNYITSLNTQRNNRSLVSKLRKIEEKTIKDKRTGQPKTIKIAKAYHKPWPNFTKETFEKLSKTVVSFKQNQRIINKTNNKTWGWEKVDGVMKKVLKKQEKRNWAIRKPIHKETYYGKVKGFDSPKGKITTATRKSLREITNERQLNTITDSGIKKILNNHLKTFIDESGKINFEPAFNQDGIDLLNKNIQQLNEGKNHQPIYKVRMYTHNTMFSVGDEGNKSTKYVIPESGTNLFFNVYWDEENNKRNFETVPLNRVIAFQKQTSHIPRKDRTDVPIDNTLGRFLFTLSPDDLVYLPTDEESESFTTFEIDSLNSKQVANIYKFVDGSGTTGNFVPAEAARVIANIKDKKVRSNFCKRNNLSDKQLIKNEFGLGSPQLKNQNSLDGRQIKSICWKLEINRLGKIIKVIK